MSEQQRRRATDQPVDRRAGIFRRADREVCACGHAFAAHVTVPFFKPCVVRGCSCADFVSTANVK